MDPLPNIVFRFSGVEFEQLSGEVRVDGRTERLRPQTAAVFVKLLECAGQVVSRDQAAESVWGDTIVTDNSLAQCVSEIRSALGPGHDKTIETVPRRGYVFRLPVERVRTAHLLEAHGAQAAQGSAAPVPVDVASPSPVGKSGGHRHRSAILWGAAAALVGGALWWGVQSMKAPEPSRLSLAVLPFGVRAGAADQSWFAETVGEDLTMNLSRIPGSLVIARVSTQGYPATGTDVRQVGRELGVRYVVTGNVDREGERVTMHLNLVDTQSGAIRWSERIDSTAAGLHGAERLVADRMAQALHIKLINTEAQRSESQHARHPEATDLALEAWAAWNRGSPKDVAKAKELAQRALALDDRSVLAWKTIASWHLRARLNQSMPAEEAISGAERAAQRAMDIDPSHPLSHTVYGGALTLRGRYEEARRALEHEIATNPSHPVAYYWLGLAQLMMGQPRAAIDLYERALAISPRDPRLSRFHRYLALAYLHDGQLPKSLPHARAATQAPQVDRSAWAMLASVCALQGDAPCAAAAVAKLREVWPVYTVELGESEWPPASAPFTAQHELFLKGLKLAGLAG